MKITNKKTLRELYDLKVIDSRLCSKGVTHPDNVFDDESGCKQEALIHDVLAEEIIIRLKAKELKTQKAIKNILIFLSTIISIGIIGTIIELISKISYMM